MFDGKTTTCTQFPASWEGQAGARQTFKSFKVTCEMMKNEDGDKQPMWFSTLYTDADCQTESDLELFAAPYISDKRCSLNYFRQAYIHFTFDECMKDLCKGIGSNKCILDDSDDSDDSESGSVALTFSTLAGIALAAVAASM